MEVQGSLTTLGIQVLVIASLWALFVEHKHHLFSTSFSRNSFPEDFMFGTASSAYQYEGAFNEGGRGLSIWDNFTHEYPERNNMANGDVAINFYHRYKEDIKLMKDINMDAFRLSISWPRILPRGKLSEGVNQEGIQFYKDLFNELLKNDIEPFVTLFHWDLPQVLEDEYGGFLSPQIVDDFRDFARLCFEEFGDKVKLWTTFNEPYVFSVAGYDNGKKAGGRCSKWVNNACREGNSGTEPYTVTHNLLLAHAAAVQEFRKCDQCIKDRKIGIVLSPPWFEPHSDSPADKEAAKRALEFALGWHLDPLTFGDYPQIMKTYVKERLPSFTDEESEILKNSYDFLGINYYGAHYAAHIDYVNPDTPRYITDQHAEWSQMDRNGIPIGTKMNAFSASVYPEGIKYILNYTKSMYNNPTIYITENGCDDDTNHTTPIEEAIKDTKRKIYHEKHLEQILIAITDYEVDVRGYFAWSLMDNFEWNFGYNVRFGLYYVDYKNDLKRYPKESGKWFKKFLHKDRKSYNPLLWITSTMDRVKESIIDRVKESKGASPLVTY